MSVECDLSSHRRNLWFTWIFILFCKPGDFAQPTEQKVGHNIPVAYKGLEQHYKLKSSVIGYMTRCEKTFVENNVFEM